MVIRYKSTHVSEYTRIRKHASLPLFHHDAGVLSLKKAFCSKWKSITFIALVCLFRPICTDLYSLVFA